MVKHQGQRKFLKGACDKWPGYTTPRLYRWKNRVLHEVTTGPKPRLTEEDEKAFKEWVEMQQDVGNCVYADEMGKVAAKWGRRLGIHNGVGGRKWVQGFLNPPLPLTPTSL